MAIKTYTTIDGVECVSWKDSSGENSMTKEAYDKMIAEKTPINE